MYCEPLETILTELEARTATQAAQIAALQQQIAALTVRVTALEQVAPPAEPKPVTGVWLSRDEIMALPMSGEAWDQVKEFATSTWGAANLPSNDTQHDVSVLAGALYAVRTSDAIMRAKVMAGLRSAMQSVPTRTLPLGRGLQAYVLAADLIGYRDPAFMAWVEDVITQPMDGRDGHATLLVSAKRDPTNWGSHARASVLAAGLYLERGDLIDAVLVAHRKWLGLDANEGQLVYGSRAWQSDPARPVGVLPLGAMINGVYVSGLLPEEWRRTNDTTFSYPPERVVTYLWEGLQGAVVVAALLARHGLLPFDAGDNAIVRGIEFLYGLGEGKAHQQEQFVLPASGDDCWIVPLVNRLGKTTLPVTLGTPGKGFGFAWVYG